MAGKTSRNVPIKTVSLCDNEKVLDTQPALAGHRASVRAPDEPGVYSLLYDHDPQIQQALVVNTPPKESDLTYFKTEPDAIKAWTLPKAELKDKSAPDFEPLTKPSLLDRENIWWSLLLAGLIALLVEIVLSAKAGVVSL